MCPLMILALNNKTFLQARVTCGTSELLEYRSTDHFVVPAWRCIAWRFIIRQRCHEFPKLGAVFRGQLDPQGSADWSFDGFFPAAARSMNIRTAPRSLACRVHKDTLVCSHDADQFAFGENRPAADAGPLWDMFYALDCFFGHRSSRIILPTPNHHHVYAV